MKFSVLFPAICLIIGTPTFAIESPNVPLEETDVFVNPAKEPEPQGNPGDFVTSMDYPSQALQLGLEGTSGFRLIVDKKGNPSNCFITESSGFAILDEGTCKALLKRAKFAPATDDQGKPVIGAWNSRLRWQIPETAIVSVPGSGYWTAIYVLNDDGSILSCELEKAEGEAQGFDFCGHPPDFYPGLDKNGKPVRKLIKVFHRVVVQDLEQ